MGRTIADLTTEDITYPGETGEIYADLVRPQGNQKRPGVIVIHENKGLNPHIKDVAGRLALEGFLTLAPDALSPLGKTPADAEKAIALIKELDTQLNLKNYLAAVKYLKTHPVSSGKVAVIGFCWGGAVANQLAVTSPDLSAAVPFYGMPPAAADVSKIKTSLLLHYAALDERINKGIPAYETALKAASIDYKMHMYPDVKHAFHNDMGQNYNKEAAQLAWQRTLSFLKEKLET